MGIFDALRSAVFKTSSEVAALSNSIDMATRQRREAEHRKDIFAQAATAAEDTRDNPVMANSFIAASAKETATVEVAPVGKEPPRVQREGGVTGQKPSNPLPAAVSAVKGFASHVGVSATGLIGGS